LLPDDRGPLVSAVSLLPNVVEPDSAAKLPSAEADPGSGISCQVWLHGTPFKPLSAAANRTRILIAKSSPSRPKPRELDLADSRAHPSP